MAKNHRCPLCIGTGDKTGNKTKEQSRAGPEAVHSQVKDLVGGEGSPSNNCGPLCRQAFSV